MFDTLPGMMDARATGPKPRWRVGASSSVERPRPLFESVANMAHTHYGIWPQLVSWENLLRAYQRCRRRKRNKPAAVAFDFDWESHLSHIRRECIEGSYRPGGYRHFFITDPKPRKISAAPFRDRVVHHALVQLLEPIFEPGFIFDSYACRRGKGTHRAINRAQTYLGRHRFYLKTDIVRFFPNVDHEIMRAALARRIGDARAMQLIDLIIRSGAGVLTDQATPSYFPGDDLFALSRPKGLPIGNLTSQFFANVLLDKIDHVIKEQWRVSGYVRYSDDLVLFGDDKDTLWEFRDKLSSTLLDLRLRLHPDKTHVAPTRQGLHFLGWKLFADSRRLDQSGIRRFTRRLRSLRWQRQQGIVKVSHISRSVKAWLAHARHGNTLGICRAVLRRAKV